MKKCITLFIYKDMATGEIKEFEKLLPPCNEKLAYLGDRSISYEPKQHPEVKRVPVSCTINALFKSRVSPLQISHFKGDMPASGSVGMVEMKSADAIQITKEDLRVAYSQAFRNAPTNTKGVAEIIFEILSQGAK